MTHPLIERGRKYLQQLAPHIAARDSAKLIHALVEALQNAEIKADDAQLSYVAAKEELELLRANNLKNCLQIANLQDELMKVRAAQEEA